MPRRFAKEAAVAGWPSSAMVLSSASVLVAAGTFDMVLVCLKFQTDATNYLLFEGLGGCEIGS